MIRHGMFRLIVDVLDGFHLAPNRASIGHGKLGYYQSSRRGRSDAAGATQCAVYVTWANDVHVPGYCGVRELVSTSITAIYGEV